MDVLVERFQRRKIVSDKDSPMLFYLRQKPRSSGTVDVDTLAASIQKNCAMTKGDVKHVIEALVEEIQGTLVNGDKVKLDQFGIFHMTFRCSGVEKMEDCKVRNIKRVHIRFTPDKGLEPRRKPEVRPMYPLLWIKRRMKMVPLPVAREVVIPAEAVIWMKIRWGKL